MNAHFLRVAIQVCICFLGYKKRKEARISNILPLSSYHTIQPSCLSCLATFLRTPLLFRFFGERIRRAYLSSASAFTSSFVILILLFCLFCFLFFFIRRIILPARTRDWSRTSRNRFIRTGPSPLGYSSKIYYIISMIENLKLMHKSLKYYCFLRTCLRKIFVRIDLLS